MTDEVAKRGRGRPKGSKNAATVLKEALIEKSEGIIIKEFPKVVKAVVKKAQDGDMSAAKLLFDRIIPARKAVEHTNVDHKGGGINIIVQGMATIEQENIPALVGEVIENDE